MTSIKVVTAAVAASVCLHAGWAQEAFNLVPLGGTAAARAAADSDTVKVQGRGVGIDEVSALKDAYRDAIERAVGLYVDAELVAKNNELVKDQILTQSNAYITDYQKLSSERIDGGLVQLRILATVKKQALTKKISDAMPTQVFSLGNDAQNLHAQMTTTEKRGGDAASLLQHALEGVDPVRQLVRFSLADPKLIRKKWGDQGERCMYRFKFEIDTDKYFQEFLPPLLRVLDQIAVEQPKDFRLSRCDGDRDTFNDKENIAEGIAYLGGAFETYDGKYIHGPREMNNDVLRKIEEDLDSRMTPQTSKAGYIPYCLHMGEADEAGIYCDISTLGNGEDPWKFPYQIDDDLADYRFKEKKTQILEAGFFQVTVITKMNKEMTNIAARRYKLPIDCFPVIWKWYASIVGRNARTKYLIEFSDGSGEELASFPVQVKNNLLLNVFLGSNRDGGNSAIFPDYSGRRGFDARPGLYVTPMILTAAQSFQTWIPFDIPQDQLSQVRSVKISLEGNGVSNANAPVTKKDGGECAALLKQALDGVDPVKQLMTFSLADSKLIRKEWGDKGERSLYRFKFEVDETKYYNVFLPPLLKVLDQIAIEQPKTFHLRKRWGSESDSSWLPKSLSASGIAYFNGEFKVYGEGQIDDGDLRSSGEEMIKRNWSPQVGIVPYVLHQESRPDGGGYGVYCNACILGTDSSDENPWCPIHGGLNIRLDRADWARDAAKECGFFQITVITKMNKSQTSISAKSYKLPCDCLDVVVDWYKKTCVNKYNSSLRTNYVISFLGDGNEEVAAFPVSFNKMDICNVFVGCNNPHGYMKSSIFRDYPSEDNLFGMYVTPMVHTCAQSFQTWIPFDLSQDQLSKIRSVKIELAD